ncbi:serine/threonine protein kinase [Ktedonobacter racemifer]|uniref:non-specific serine/threonine protein kinase n=1 Tax=Ktedonobacter racemifer DSM 44963 TaxID=485913 RepID=D6TTP1_KTERA|nr:serine/threonine-protein kinase [Ktedonobacter racemifer]EFH83792.1 serine/threonine protein kinase [Ktedonobacter racemifer DSM 44963]
MADSVEDRVGQQLGNYRLLRLLRREHGADVYLGEHIFLKTQVALKVLPGQLAPGALETFLAETRRVARLKHPNILRVLEFGVEGNLPFLVTDYTPYGTLRQRHPEGTGVPAAQVVSYVRQLTSALQYIHDQGLVHGRVRPENMLLGPQGRVLLGDFSPSTETPVSDQYDLAVTVYEWLSGEPLIPGTPTKHLEQLLTLTTQPAMSPELRKVLTNALAPGPQRHYANITAFALALEQALAPLRGLGQHGSQILVLSPLDRGYTDNKGRRLVIAISIILVLLLLIGGIVSYNTGIFPFARSTVASLSPAQATQTVTTRGAQQAVATFTARSPQQIYTASTSGPPFINDPLTSQGASTWQSLQGQDYGCTFSGGAYHVQLARLNSYLNCARQKNVFHNFAFEVEMSVIKGDGGGIFFRADSAHANFYVLRLISDGAQAFVGLSFYTSHNNQATIKDIKDTFVSANSQAFNLLSIVAYEHTFYLYLNRQPLLTAQDTALDTGGIGVYALNSNKPATEVAFRNAKLWKL